MPQAFKKVDYTLSALVSQIKTGTIGLPELQRPFVWADAKVRDLFDSMYKGYPVGFFLFWANAMTEKTKAIGADPKQKYPTLLVVDGQQRLTSLYAVLTGETVVREDYSISKITVSFDPLNERFLIPDAATRRNPEYIQDISELWSPEFDQRQYINGFIDRLAAGKDLSIADEKKIGSAINQLCKLDSYLFSALELLAEINEEEVAEIFVRINSEGKKLNQADFILTLMSVFWDEGRKQLESFSRDSKMPSGGAPGPFNFLIRPAPDQLLRTEIALGFKRARLRYAYSILRGKALDSKDTVISEDRRDTQFELLRTAQAHTLHLTNWHEFLKAIKTAGYIRKDYISSEGNVMYCYAAYLIGHVDFGMGHRELRYLIARWFFTTSLTGRYTGNAESRMERDLNEMREAQSSAEFVAWFDREIELSLPNDFWLIQLPNLLDSSAARGPALFGFYAALQILGAQALFSDLPVAELLQAGVQSNKSALEKHHLFPKAYLKRLGITRTQRTNQIANYALVEWSENIAISDQQPPTYMLAYRELLPSDQIARQYHHHALWEGWENEEYNDFLEKRRGLIAGVVREAFEKLSARKT